LPKLFDRADIMLLEYVIRGFSRAHQKKKDQEKVSKWLMVQ